MGWDARWRILREPIDDVSRSCPEVDLLTQNGKPPTQADADGELAGPLAVALSRLVKVREIVEVEVQAEIQGAYVNRPIGNTGAEAKVEVVPARE